MKYFYILLLMIHSINVFATQKNCLIVHFSDGSYVAFPLDQSPRVTFEGNTVHISDQHYQVSNVRKYTIGDSDHVGIETFNAGENQKPYSLDGISIVVKVGSVFQKVRLHTVGGVEIPITAKPDVNGYMRIPLSQLAEQVYLLTIGNETIKIRRP